MAMEGGLVSTDPLALPVCRKPRAGGTRPRTLPRERLWFLNGTSDGNNTTKAGFRSIEDGHDVLDGDDEEQMVAEALFDLANMCQRAADTPDRDAKHDQNGRRRRSPDGDEDYGETGKRPRPRRAAASSRPVEAPGSAGRRQPGASNNHRPSRGEGHYSQHGRELADYSKPYHSQQAGCIDSGLPTPNDKGGRAPGGRSDNGMLLRPNAHKVPDSEVSSRTANGVDVNEQQPYQQQQLQQRGPTIVRVKDEGGLPNGAHLAVMPKPFQVGTVQAIGPAPGQITTIPGWAVHPSLASLPPALLNPLAPGMAGKVISMDPAALAQVGGFPCPAAIALPHTALLRKEDGSIVPAASAFHGSAMPLAAARLASPAGAAVAVPGPKPRFKRCATHVYIAHLIRAQQQMAHAQQQQAAAACAAGAAPAGATAAGASATAQPPAPCDAADSQQQQQQAGGSGGKAASGEVAPTSPAARPGSSSGGNGGSRSTSPKQAAQGQAGGSGSSEGDAKPTAAPAPAAPATVSSGATAAGCAGQTPPSSQPQALTVAATPSALLPVPSVTSPAAVQAQQQAIATVRPAGPLYPPQHMLIAPGAFPFPFSLASGGLIHAGPQPPAGQPFITFPFAPQQQLPPGYALAPAQYPGAPALAVSPTAAAKPRGPALDPQAQQQQQQDMWVRMNEQFNEQWLRINAACLPPDRLTTLKPTQYPSVGP